MPGVGIKHQWKGKPPLYWTIPAIIFFLFGSALIFSSDFLPYITVPTGSPGHSHEVMVRGAVRYMNPILWWCYDKGEWVCGILLLWLILIMLLRRNQIERVR